MPQLNFPIKIVKRETNSISHCCEFHWHKQIEIYYVERGGIHLLCGDEKRWLHSNDIAIVNPYEPHRSLGFLDNTLHYVILIDLSLLISDSSDVCYEKYVSPLISNEIYLTNWITNDKSINDIIQIIIKEYNECKFGYELVIKSNFMALLSILLRNYCTKASKTKNLDNRMELQHVIKISNYISENFNNTIALKTLSNLVSLSIPYMCRIFKKYTGSTIVDYINQIRCQKAISLISCGYSITDVALMVGFNDSNYFSRIFKKVVGVAPSKIKNSKEP